MDQANKSIPYQLNFHSIDTLLGHNIACRNVRQQEAANFIVRLMTLIRSISDRLNKDIRQFAQQRYRSHCTLGELNEVFFYVFLFVFYRFVSTASNQTHTIRRSSILLGQVQIQYRVYCLLTCKQKKYCQRALVSDGRFWLVSWLERKRQRAAIRIKLFSKLDYSGFANSRASFGFSIEFDSCQHNRIK